MSFDLLEPPIVGNEAGLESLDVAIASPLISVPVTFSITCTVLDSTSSNKTNGQDHLQPTMLGRTGLLHRMHQRVTIHGANLQLATCPVGFRNMHCNLVSKLFAHLPVGLYSAPAFKDSNVTLSSLQPCILVEVPVGLQHHMVTKTSVKGVHADMVSCMCPASRHDMKLSCETAGQRIILTCA